MNASTQPHRQFDERALRRRRILAAAQVRARRAERASLQLRLALVR